MDGQTDRRMGKNNMSSDPEGGRHKYKFVYFNGLDKIQLASNSKYVTAVLAELTFL